MTDGPFNWIMLYFICFSVGLALAALSFFTMHLHVGHLRFGRGHAGHGAGAHGQGSAHQHLSALNSFTITGFLCWFGAAGYLLSRHSWWGAMTVCAMATACGLGGAAVLFAFLRFLNRFERVLDPADTEISGMLGRISQPVIAGGVGEMLYLQNGARRSVAVRSEDGSAIPREAEVVVMSFARGVASVRPWSAFEAGLLHEKEGSAAAREEPQRLS